MNGAGWFLAGLSAGIFLATLAAAAGTVLFGRRSLGKTKLGSGLWEVLIVGDGHIVDAGLIDPSPAARVGE